MTGPCDWPLLLPGNCDALSTLEPDTKDAIEQMATAWLWTWTNGQYGQCEVALRPCRRDCDAGSAFFGTTSGGGWGADPENYELSSGSFLAGRPPVQRQANGTLARSSFMACGLCRDGCSCGSGDSLRLPGPVAEVIEVRIDGSPVDPATYRVDNYSLLVDMSGYGWPRCQDMGAPVTAADTWQVTYTQGLPVPTGGQVAAGALACELAKAQVGDATCQLPRRVTSVSRQGVTMTMDPAELSAGGTGIWLVDSWVAMVTRKPQGASVYSVDVPRPRQRVTTWAAT